MTSRSPVNAQHGTKRHINNMTMGGGSRSENNAGNADSSMLMDGADPETVRLLLEDIKAKLDKRLKVLETSLMTTQQTINNGYSMEMVKVPKSVKQMTVREFNQKHGCNILDLLKRNDGVILSSASNSNPSNSLKRPLPPVAETPAPRSRPAQDPGSILRTVKRGEQVFSKNGSPVDTVDEGALIATVTKKRKGNDANFEINVGEGRYISLNDPTGVQGLDSDMRATAASQLKVLQDQMASLMAQLQN